MRRADEALNAAEHRNPREAHDLVRGSAVEADLAQRAVVEAGQHGHGQNLRAAALHRFLRGLEHFESAAGMDGDELHVERDGRLHRVGDGLRNVVPFLVEKNVDTLGAHGLHDGRALAREELVADLEQAQVGFQQAHERERLVGAIHIEGKNQFVGRGHAGITGWQ